MVVNKVAVLVIAGMVGGLFYAGCGGASVDGVCQKACDCATSCKSADVQTCESEGAQLQQAAEKAGCGGLFDDELACFDGLTCKNHELVNTPCEAEVQAVEKCVGNTTDGPQPG